jgi:hypothetical protein
MVGYGTRYIFEFDGSCKPFTNQAIQVVAGKVLILKKDFSGSVTTIPHGQVTPVEIDYPTNDDDIFYPIKGSVLSFKVLGGAISMDSIISEDEREYYLEYYRDGALFWSGFISPELCEEDIFLRYPAIEFKTIDGLGSFNALAIKDNQGRSLFGKRTLLDIVISALRQIGFNYDVNILSNVWANGFNKTLNPLVQTFTYLNIFRDKNGVVFKTMDIIKSICYLFNAIIYQDKGQWWFVKIKDLAFNYNTTQRYNYSGTGSTGSQTIPVLSHGTDFLIVAEPRRKIRRFYKEVGLDYQFYNSFSNIDTNFSIWSNDDTYTPVRILQADFPSNVLEFNVVRTGANPAYSFYTKNGSIKADIFYDPRVLDYGVVLYSDFGNNTDYLEFPDRALKVGDTFSISCSSITGNQKLEILIDDSPTAIRYYSIFTNSWTTTRTYNTSGYYPTLSATNIEVPIDGNLKIRLHSAMKFDETGTYFSGYDYVTAYHGLTVSVNAPKSSNQVTTITNTKNTSIIPQTITVYSGDYQDNPYSSVIEYTDISNLFDQSDFPTKEWVERAEEYAYEIQELSARNILNQYSDYRNIFTGTIIGKNLRFGAIYSFPVQGALADKKFFPLSMKLNERDCTAEVVFMELTSNEIVGAMNQTIFDTDGNIVYQELVSSKKKIVTG